REIRRPAHRGGGRLARDGRPRNRRAGVDGPGAAHLLPGRAGEAQRTGQEGDVTRGPSPGVLMKRLLLCLLLLPVADHAARAPAQPANPEDARLAALFKEYLEAEFKARPLEATRLGDHRYDHLLDDLSPKARAASAGRWRKALQELSRRISYKRLSRAGQIDYEIFAHHLKRDLWLAENTRAFED